MHDRRGDAREPSRKLIPKEFPLRSSKSQLVSRRRCLLAANGKPEGLGKPKNLKSDYVQHSKKEEAVKIVGDDVKYLEKQQPRAKSKKPNSQELKPNSQEQKTKCKKLKAKSEELNAKSYKSRSAS